MTPYAKMKGFFVKNYSKKQIVIDRENFNSAVVYPLAKKVFGKNFSKNPLAQSLYDDMVQEAVTRLFELSGKTKEMANGKYSENYANFWIAHNAMLALGGYPTFFSSSFLFPSLSFKLALTSFSFPEKLPFLSPLAALFG